MTTGFEPRYEDLPHALPIFPLSGVLLLPRGKLPLNIFEPRYIAMIEESLAAERMIGMIQPCEDGASATEPAVYPIGCAGRITSFSEAEGRRYLITLTGVARFDIVAELERHRGYRRVVPRWTRFRSDLDVEEPPAAIDRARLLAATRIFFRVNGITADWKAVNDTPDERLVTSLAMICPFAPSEKQALLEAADCAERSRVITALMEMAALSGSGAGDEAARH